jgi:hypothetical protein
VRNAARCAKTVKVFGNRGDKAIDYDVANVRYWHKADIGLRGLNVSFGGKAGIIPTWRSCLLLTQSGHGRCTDLMTVLD